ncbi:MAG: 3-methyl-2-oxobutanoate dehydrogenase subunit VorB [Anaerolineaceae bacterium]|nr:3-methyl-2-oxobutanoate dehydrogenase subunit VorB [Anaerolineaceae bacterium]
MAKELIKGNIAFAEAAIRAGLDAYFGYPITPQTEALEWMSARMPELGRAFVQAESELGAINMVYGTACTGKRVMTSSSSPGISLMLEGVSYIATSEVPIVLVNVMRGGPGLGNISPAQSDYNQAVHGGGHGDYYPIVLAPANIQELIDITYEAFDLAEKYRSVVIILIDGSIGQMMEPAELPPFAERKNTAPPSWAVTGAKGRKPNVICSLEITPEIHEVTNMRLINRWHKVQENEVRFKEYYLDDAEYAIVGFGTAGRIALSAVRAAREQGIKVGLLRPISLAPFPEKRLLELSKQVKSILVTEMNAGQMLDDVLRVVRGNCPVQFYGRAGGPMPLPDDLSKEIDYMMSNPANIDDDPRAVWYDRLMAELGLEFND